MAGSRDSYHHGNLRQALVDAALALIAEKGAGGFSFADVARATGVSPAAPNRHFPDRDALMAEVARQGFARLTDALEAAWDGGEPSPLAAFEAVARAHLAFARDEPAAYAAMFRRDAPGDRDAAVRAFAVLEEAVRRLIRHLPGERRPPAHMMALHVRALTHGVAELFGPGAPGRAPMSAGDLLESALMIYLRGLGLIPHDE
jgi:AcrR family transcriptional regulator